MTHRCVIVDDEPLARNLLAEYVSKVPSLELVATASSALAALDILRDNTVDILFLDVQMPELTGISLLKVLQKKPLVVLTTAYSEYALEGYELDVADYLLKPITFERFLRTVDKLRQRLATPAAPGSAPTIERSLDTTAPFVFVKDGTRLVKIFLDDILYVEGLKDYVTIHTRQQKVISLQRLKTLEEHLPAERFVRIHNSFIVSLHAIDAVHKGEVQVGQALLPIGETYKKAFKDLIDRRHIQ